MFLAAICAFFHKREAALTNNGQPGLQPILRQEQPILFDECEVAPEVKRCQAYLFERKYRAVSFAGGDAARCAVRAGLQRNVRSVRRPCLVPSPDAALGAGDGATLCPYRMMTASREMDLCVGALRFRPACGVTNQFHGRLQPQLRLDVRAMRFHDLDAQVKFFSDVARALALADGKTLQIHGRSVFPPGNLPCRRGGRRRFPKCSSPENF